MHLLEVRHLRVHFPVKRGILSRARAHIKAVDDVGFDLVAGETLGLVGESGCGKTTLGRAIVRLTEPTAGRGRFDGEDITPLTPRGLRRASPGVQITFQLPACPPDTPLAPLHP